LDAGLAVPSSASREGERELLMLEVVSSLAAPALVRAALGQIEGLGGAREDIVQVASELVTHAVRHVGRGSPTATLSVRVRVIGGAVWISVRGAGLSGDPFRLQDAAVIQASGLGLAVLDQLARGWGFDRGGGYRAWAEVSPGSCP
jgi:anti-sigma regulatory factor (Ser/Thr protein kinase)